MTEASIGQQGDGSGGRGKCRGGRGNSRSRGGRGRGRGRGGRSGWGGRDGGGNNKKKDDEKKGMNKDGDIKSKDKAKAKPKPNSIINNKSNNNASNKGGGTIQNIGGNSRNRRRNSQNKNHKKGGKNQEQISEFTQKMEEEKKKVEEERLKKIEEEAERKRLEEEEKALQALREIRKMAEEELNNKYQEAIDYLKVAADISEARKANRNSMTAEDLLSSRKAFEADKKSLKSDLKKCTAFVKKIKTGGAWLLKPNDIVRDISTLNLSRYVEEVVAGVLEAKLKLTDLPVVLALCKAMHQRYQMFLSFLMAGMWSVIHGKPTEETGKLRRIYVRLLTEFILNGLSNETKPLMKLIAETSGGKDGSYIVTDANIVVAFVKAAGFEILGTRPTSVQRYYSLIEEEILKKKQQQQKENIDEEDINAPVLISEEMVAKGKHIVKMMDELLVERAVSVEISNKCLGHCKGAYGFLSKTLVHTDTKLQKMEKRCELDRLLAGSLTEAREKGLQDARKLRESLQKSIEAMSDILDLLLPQLEKNKEEELEGGSGVEVWTKNEGDEDGADFGPFDDEETRSFYCDVPDFLTTVPPGLIGVSPEEIEKRKAINVVKFGSTFGVDNDIDGDTVTDEVAPSSEAELEAAEKEEEKESGDEKDESLEENKDTPHYKLMVLLEQELPECSRREQIDEISEKFCTNHGSSKNARKRLSQTLFHVPRARLDLLPYFSRMAATLSRVWSDIGDALLVDLEQQFHGQAKFKKNQNIESRLRTARYIGELTKFRMAPPIVSLRCLRRCMDDFTGGNVDVACCLLESCGRYLYRLPHTKDKLNNIMETMVRLSKAKRLEERYLALINTAMYTVKPPASGNRKQAKEYPPLEGYLRHVLMVTLEPSESSISFVSKQLLRFPWRDPSVQCGPLICKIMLKACRVGRYRSIQAVANVAAKLRRQKPEVCIRLLDCVVEELQWSIEHPAFKDQQRTLTVARLLGELYVASLASGQLIIQQLYHFINFGHEIPEALREASEKAVALSESLEENLPVFNSASGISHSILEDEEMDQDELEAKEVEVVEEEVVKPVILSIHSKYDPRVPTVLDLPNSVFRIKLICTLLEVISKTYVTKNNLPKTEAFLAAFQRYLFTKTTLPTEVEFSLLDTFDIIDSHWREALKEQKKKNTGDVDKSEGFRRYRTWLEAHNATVLNEETEAAIEIRAHVRLEALAGNGTLAAEVGAGDILSEEDELEEEEDDDSATEDGLSLSDHESISVDDGNNEETIGDQDESTIDNDEFDEDSDDSDDDDDSEEEFDEDAYMKQLEEEAFEAELRRLTMDALEKGKSISRGGKVSDNMPTGSQFIKKKQADTQEANLLDNTALGGMEGISFNLLKKGNKGKMEAKQFFVPKDTNLAAVATKQDDEAERERNMIKARVLQYEAESADSGGNVYLEQEKLQVIRNRPLSMDEIDKNFGTTGGNLVNAPSKKAVSAAGGNQNGGRGGRGYSFGRGGRGRGRSSGRGLV
mmetsp:Transcript_36545/g.41100  ORF Transcript_36545/g.41100 Transcript_36545/m.41100 type:complete len:1502 (+) Transcript_36545:86-4591(+)